MKKKKKNLSHLVRNNTRPELKKKKSQQTTRNNYEIIRVGIFKKFSTVDTSKRISVGFEIDIREFHKPTPPHGVTTVLAVFSKE